MRQLLRFLLVFVLATGGAWAFAQQPFSAGQVAQADLPPEARHTLNLIKQGGPFPYDRDGVIFGNFEKRLPREKRGFYHEYTVKTPGERSRGARRIIAGDTPPRVYYYTDDHYQSFRRIQDER
jgi:ribonuclease T1